MDDDSITVEIGTAAEPRPSHEFVGVAGHPDDDECAHREDGTDATYCGRPREEHHDPTWWGDPRDHQCGGTWGVCDDDYDPSDGVVMHRCVLEIDHDGPCWCGPCSTWSYDDEGEA